MTIFQKLALTEAEISVASLQKLQGECHTCDASWRNKRQVIQGGDS